MFIKDEKYQPIGQIPTDTIQVFADGQYYQVEEDIFGDSTQSDTPQYSLEDLVGGLIIIQINIRGGIKWQQKK